MAAAAKAPSVLLRAAALLGGVALLLACLLWSIRLAVEFGESPWRYVLKDAGIALATLVFGIACLRTYRRWDRDADAAKATQRLDQLVRESNFEGTRLEASLGGCRSVFMLVVGLLVLGFGILVALAQVQVRGSSVALMLVAFIGGAGTLWLLARLRPWGRPTLVLDADGIRHGLAGEVRWSDVVGLSRMNLPIHVGAGSADREVLVVGLRDPGCVRQRGLARWLVPSRHSMRIVLTGLDQPAERILAAAFALRDRVQPPRESVWFPGMTEGHRRSVVAQQRVLERLEGIASGPDPIGPEAAREVEELLAGLEQQRPAREAELRALGAKVRRLKWLLWMASALALAFLAYQVWRIATGQAPGGH
jgi:hypothetical protein